MSSKLKKYKLCPSKNGVSCFKQNDNNFKLAVVKNRQTFCIEKKSKKNAKRMNELNTRKHGLLINKFELPKKIMPFAGKSVHIICI